MKILELVGGWLGMLGKPVTHGGGKKGLNLRFYTFDLKYIVYSECMRCYRVVCVCACSVWLVSTVECRQLIEGKDIEIGNMKAGCKRVEG